MKILSTAAMRSVDRAAVEELGVPGVVLMENAALGVVEAALARVPSAESAAVFCGPGNNGGDGLAIARHLAVRGLRTRALVLTEGRGYTGDAAVQFEIARKMQGLGLELEDLDQTGELTVALERAAQADLVIDALFGTGLSRPLEGRFAELVAAINELPAPIIAVDLPSGLGGDHAEILGPHIEAEVTVTFAAPKIAHIFMPAASSAGEVVVSDLGIPDQLVERAEGDLFLLEPAHVAALLGPRQVDAHKGDFGHLLVVAGSAGKSGAAVLATQAAIRAGAGLVTAAVPEDVLPTFAAASIESMSVGLPVTSSGLGDPALAALRAAATEKSAVALGPGLGTAEATGETIRRFVLESGAPLALDADGLNAFAGRLELLAARKAPAVLTPHPGELGRLLGVETGEVTADRLGSVRAAAERSGSVVVLKGHLSVIAAPGEGVFVNPTGNPGMATGGSGDVLTGMIGALLGQGLDPIAAAQLGTFVHGLAGDLAAGDVGEVSLSAGDLLGRVPAAFEIVSGRRPFAGACKGREAEEPGETRAPE